MRLELYKEPDGELWPQALQIYQDAFPTGKPVAVLESMLASGLCAWAAGFEQEKLVAMAIIGYLPKPGLLLVDYLAVERDSRDRGLGHDFLQQLIDRTREEGQANGLLVEAEAEETTQNERRIRFWEQNGFHRTAYVHQYIWVPEPYRALYLAFENPPPFPTDGQALFQFIGNFHRLSFRPLT